MTSSASGSSPPALRGSSGIKGGTGDSTCAAGTGPAGDRTAGLPRTADVCAGERDAAARELHSGTGSTRAAARGEDAEATHALGGSGWDRQRAGGLGASGDGVPASGWSADAWVTTAHCAAVSQHGLTERIGPSGRGWGAAGVLRFGGVTSGDGLGMFGRAGGAPVGGAAGSSGAGEPGGEGQRDSTRPWRGGEVRCGGVSLGTRACPACCSAVVAGETGADEHTATCAGGPGEAWREGWCDEVGDGEPACMSNDHSAQGTVEMRGYRAGVHG